MQYPPELLARAWARAATETGTLEQLFTSASGFGLTTATPLQRAICRVFEGRPLGDLAEREDVRSAFGNIEALPVGKPPSELLLLSGIRTAKSLLAAALAVNASQRCDVSRLGAGETPRVSVVSLTIDLATVIFGHITGNLTSKPALRGLLIGEPKAGSVLVRHPTGKPVEIKVVAGSRAGASLVARWSAGCIFDEAPRMVGADEGVVNFDDARGAVLGRMIPGAQIVSIGSPWAPFGPIYNMQAEHWGKPSQSLVVVRAPAPAMNPVWWTPERVAELAERDPSVYRTDVLGEFADPETSLLSSDLLKAATRSEPSVPRAGGCVYAAAMDPGTRGNSWTLAIATKLGDADGAPLVVARAQQWTGSKVAPLSPKATLREIANICREYGVDHVTTDGWAADAIVDLARDEGLTVDVRTVTAAEKVELYENFRTHLANKRVELPPDPVVRSDLLSVRKRVTQNGVAIVLPHSSDGRHADFAPSIVLVIDAVASGPDRIEPPPAAYGGRWGGESRGFG